MIEMHLTLKDIKRVGAVFIYFDNFQSLMLADNIDMYLSFVIIYGNFLKYITAIAQLLQ